MSVLVCPDGSRSETVWRVGGSLTMFSPAAVRKRSWTERRETLLSLSAPLTLLCSASFTTSSYNMSERSPPPL